MAQISYKVGKLLGQNPSIITAIIVAVVGGAIYTAVSSNHTDPQPATTATAPEKPSCAEKKQALLAEYQAKMAQGEPALAAAAVRPCAYSSKDQELSALALKAEAADHVKTANNKTSNTFNRLLAIERIEESDAALGATFSKLKAELTRKQAAEALAAKKAIAAQKRSEGVRIGMTAEDVIASSWGKPRSINKSIYSFGVHEQWVYHGRNYLYFKDGILDSVQTGE